MILLSEFHQSVICQLRLCMTVLPFQIEVYSVNQPSRINSIGNSKKTRDANQANELIIFRLAALHKTPIEVHLTLFAASSLYMEHVQCPTPKHPASIKGKHGKVIVTPFSSPSGFSVQASDNIALLLLVVGTRLWNIFVESTLVNDENSIKREAERAKDWSWCPFRKVCETHKDDESLHRDFTSMEFDYISLA